MTIKPQGIGQLLIVASLFLFLSAYYLKHLPTPEKARVKAEAAFQEKELLARKWLLSDSLWQIIERNDLNVQAFSKLEHISFPVFYLKNNKLKSWGGPDNLLQSEQITERSGKVQQTPNQHYILLSQTSDTSNHTLVVAIPVDSASSVKHPDWLPIHDADGQVVYYTPIPLSNDNSAAFSFSLEAIALVLFLAALFLLSCKRSLKSNVSQKKQNGYILLALLIGGIGITLWIQSLGKSPSLVIKQLSDASLGGKPLIYFIIWAFFSPWMLNQLQHIKSDKRPSGLSIRLLLAGFAYSSIGIGLAVVVYYIHELILNSGLAFDFQNVLLMGGAVFWSLLSIPLYLLCILLYSIWMVKNVQLMGLSRNRRFISMGGAIILSGLCAVTLSLDLPLPVIFLALILYIALLDLFIEIKAASPAWMLLWLTILTAFATGMLFKTNLEQGTEDRRNFAAKLVNPEDTLAEAGLNQLVATLKDSVYLPAQIGNVFRQIPYLNKNYRIQIASNSYSDIDSCYWYKRSPNVHYINYSLHYAVGSGTQYVLDFQPVINESESIFLSLVPKGILSAPEYGLAILLDGESILQRGYINEEWLNQKYWSIAGPTDIISSQMARSYLGEKKTRYQVMITEQLGGYYKPASLFSFLFAIFILITLLTFFLNRYFTLFPATPGVLLIGEPSLRHRIQITTIVLVLLTFIIAGFVTIAFIRKTVLNDQAQQIYKSMDIILREMKRYHKYPYTDETLANVAEIYQLDICAYSSEGHLKSASSNYLFDKHLKTKRLSSSILFTHLEEGFNPIIKPQQAGSLNYRSAFIPLQQSDDTLEGFLELVYPSGKQELKSIAIDFIGSLLNLYVFLLIFTSAFALVVAKSITRPILEMGQKLRRIRLGKNEPLEWNSQDEIGQLVDAYNDMIVELEESTEKLRQSEREGAWREMAKQVAHEIKNPLTPMKLSIQHLRRAQQLDPDRAQELIGRVARTMIEQIDGLAHIATAFSNFARMPKPQMEEVDMKSILQDVYLLFTENMQSDITIRLHLPDEAVSVYADAKQLTRIFNNLIKNAQQAIPDSRKGEIEISLRVEEGKVSVRVQDNGNGIPPEIQPKVFQPNFTTKSSGMGLGLAMCKNMVEDMGGTIYFETKEGEGTSFYVEMNTLTT